MKKLRRQLRVVILLLGAVSLLLSNAMAQGGGGGPPPLSETVPISATVGEYARLTVVRGLMNRGTFTGEPNKERGPKDNAVFEVETNTALDLKFSGGDLSNGASSLKTAYAASRVEDGADLGYFNRERPDYTYIGDLTVSSGQEAGTTRTYEILGYAKTEPDVSSQEAGNYSANITLTVSAP